MLCGEITHSAPRQLYAKAMCTGGKGQKTLKSHRLRAIYNQQLLIGVGCGIAPRPLSVRPEPPCAGGG